MTCTVLHLIGPNGGKTLPRGTRPAKPVRWDVSIWFVLPSGEKFTHAFTVAKAMMFDLVPLVNEQVGALMAEHGSDVTGAGWQAHGRGAGKAKKRR